MKVKCVNGHEFDPSLTPGGVCPQCGEMGKVQDFDSSGMTLPPINSGFPSFGATEPAPGWNAQAGGGDGQKTTFPGGGSFQNYGETMPAGAAWQQNAAQGSSFQEYGATMPANAVPGGETVPPTGGWPNAKSASHYPGVENYDGLTMPLGGIRSGAVPQYGPSGVGTSTIAIAPKPPLVYPVVGWLVCISGPERGRSYPIHPEYNYVGRDARMDICINDSVISHENQFVIAYVSKTRRFYASSAGGKNITELNGLPLMQREELHAYDRFSVGTTTLLFIPFCGEQFGWDDVEKQAKD